MESERAVVREVLIRGPISRRELGLRVGLAAPSLTRLLKPFLSSGMLVEVDEPGERSVGRPVRLLDVAPGWGRFAGVKLTGDRVYLAITDGRARVIQAVDERLVDPSPSAVARQISGLLPAGVALDGVGVSVGGVVDSGTVEDGVFLGWRGIDFARLLEERIGVAVAVENDVVALAEAHRWFGDARDRPGFALITIGVGVGYGLAVNGSVVRTREAGVSLAAHLRLVDTDRACPSGHEGCASAMLTTEAIETRHVALGGSSVSVEAIYELAAEGDAIAERVVGESAEALGRFVALAANLSLQSTVVLAGDGVGLWAVAERRIRGAAAADRDDRADPLDIVVDDAGFTAWARGAAVVAIQSAIGSLLPSDRRTG